LSAVSHRAVRWRGLVTLAIAIVLAAGLGQTNRGHAILGRVGLFQEPTSYTSLAFLNPQSLPEQLSSKKAIVGVSFVINNTGGIPHDYQWSVLLVQGRRTHHVAVGNVRIASGSSVAITRSASISCTRGQVRIIVSLARPAEFIDAWTTCSSPRK
jgi:hypothetical protein